MDTVDKRFGLLASAGIAYVGGYLLVGKKHKLFHKFVGVFRHFEIHAYRVSGLVDFKTHLEAVEVDRAMLEAAFAQRFGETVEGEYLLGIVALAGLDYFLRLLIGEAAVALYHGFADAVVDDVGVVVHLKDA